MASKVKLTKHLSVGDFFKNNAELLGLELVGSDVGFDRKILEPSTNRPGLALGGFFNYFPFKRLQVLGHSEQSYLSSMKPEVAEQAFNRLMEWDVPCFVTTRGQDLPKALIALAEKAHVSVFRTAMQTMHFINAATMRLEWDFAPTTVEHGCMVDVRGIGVLIRGASGTGKSETVLGLLERGHSLVADDAVVYRAPAGQELIGTSKEMGRFLMEVRGLGFVNVLHLFGVGAMRREKRLDLVVTLEFVEDLSEMERVGTKQEEFDILKRKVPLVRLPVAPGRDMARLVETAALEYKLRGLGVNAADDLSKKLLQSMSKSSIGQSAIL